MYNFLITSLILHSVLLLSEFLLENITKFSNDVADVQALNVQLEHNSQQMKEQVMYMREDWKREQELVVTMTKDLKFKEE